MIFSASAADRVAKVYIIMFFGVERVCDNVQFIVRLDNIPRFEFQFII